MSEQITDYQAVERGILACARFLAEKLENPDGHAAVIEKIVPLYLAKNDVDRAAQLADSVESSFVRDNLLVEVAAQCAANGDDEYALQLADAIEDASFQEAARERIVICKAEKRQFDKALEIAATVNHNSSALGAVALELQANGDENRALETLEKIEDAAIKTHYLQLLALEFNKNEQSEKALNLLDAAQAETEKIEVEEEEIRALQEIAYAYGEIGRRDRAIEILAQAQKLTEEITTSARRDALLGEISGDFLRAGSLDLADRTLDLVIDKTVIAAVLTVYAAEYYRKNERAEALDILEEARGILKAYFEAGVRNSEETANVLSSVAVHFALFGEPERAIAVALENPFDDWRYSALAQIAQICVSENKNETAQRAVGAINDRAKNLEALIAIADARRARGDNAEALKLLGTAHLEVSQVDRPLLKVALLGSLAASFYQAGGHKAARGAASDNLDQIPRILAESRRAVALADLAAVYETLGVELDRTEKDRLLALLRQENRF